MTHSHSYRGVNGIFTHGMSLSIGSDEDENDKLNSLIDDYRRENERCS